MPITINGKDNSGKPRQDFADKIGAMNDDELFDETKKFIFLSAYANNNPRSDYHWMVDACYDEACERGKPEIYTRAWEFIAGEAA